MLLSGLVGGRDVTCQINCVSLWSTSVGIRWSMTSECPSSLVGVPSSLMSWYVFDSIAESSYGETGCSSLGVAIARAGAGFIVGVLVGAAINDIVDVEASLVFT